MSYNGWTNWATWNAALWMDQEYDIYKKRKARNLRTTDAVREFFIDIFTEKGTPDMDPGDIDNVDWSEIAAHWKAEFDEDQADLAHN